MAASTIAEYNAEQEGVYGQICKLLEKEINANLPGSNSKVWHASPVWFINDNPIVGYHRQKGGLQLMFWSGLDFDEPTLTQVGKYPTAAIFYNSLEEVNLEDLQRWLKKAITIQWDYKNIVKRRGVLERLK